MFRGLTPTFAREMPGYFCFFGGYELCRHFLTPEGKTKDEIGIRTTCLKPETLLLFFFFPFFTILKII